MTEFLFNEEIQEKIIRAEKRIAFHHQEIDRIALINQKRVMDSFARHQVADFHFSPTTGYGYDDLGRDTLEAIYADVFGGKLLLSGTKSSQAPMQSRLLYLACCVQAMNCFIYQENLMIRLKKLSAFADMALAPFVITAFLTTWCH